MNCPKCNGKTTVMESRKQRGGTIRRRRRCTKCGTRFTTLEMIWEIDRKRTDIACSVCEEKTKENEK